MASVESDLERVIGTELAGVVADLLAGKVMSAEEVAHNIAADAKRLYWKKTTHLKSDQQARHWSARLLASIALLGMLNYRKVEAVARDELKRIKYGSIMGLHSVAAYHIALATVAAYRQSGGSPDHAAKSFEQLIGSLAERTARKDVQALERLRQSWTMPSERSEAKRQYAGAKERALKSIRTDLVFFVGTDNPAAIARLDAKDILEKLGQYRYCLFPGDVAPNEYRMPQPLNLRTVHALSAVKKALTATI